MYDIVFRNALVVDGTGTPSFHGDVAVAGNSIVAVGALGNSTAAVIEKDCSGLVLAPGFIDIHNHSDRSILANPTALNYVTQGVTSLVVGNCGSSAAPVNPEFPEFMDMVSANGKYDITWTSFGEYLQVLDNLPKAVNIAALFGHGNIRGAVLGVQDRAASADDLAVMKQLVREAMDAGAFGMSTGLIYVPGVFSTDEEVLELASVVGEYNGLYTTHMRNESDLLVEAVTESIRVTAATGTRLQISHHKASGKRNWGLVKTTLDLMEYHRRFGVEVTCDMYPYTASATGLYTLFPRWARQDGKAEFRRLLQSEDVRARLRHELSHPSREWENILLDAGFDGLIVSHSSVFANYEGKTVEQVARERSEAPVDTLINLAAGDTEIGVIAGGMSEDDVRYVLAHRLGMVCSDGSVLEFGKGVPHPRNYQSFVRAIAEYARDEPVLTLEQAIHKMTGFPAWKLGLADRGVIRPGARADLTIFDYWGLNCQLDYTAPHQFAEGITHVLVNGQFALRNGEFVADSGLERCGLAGEVLRRP